jgi:hypothetical protein
MNDKDIKLRNAVRARGITALYHFSPLSNLKGILEHGLLSRDVLDAHDMPYTYTDDRRDDGNLDAVSLSIQVPYLSMLKAKIPNSRCRWMILEIQPSVLWTHSRRFCWDNAASTEMRKHKGFKGGPWAFNMMFEHFIVSNLDQRSRRDVWEIPDNEPTLEGAEVQIFDPISPDLIRDVTISRELDRNLTEAAMTRAGRSLPIAVNHDAFKP